MAVGTDIREPQLFEANGRLQLQFFQGGVNPAAFEPVRMLRVWRVALGNWTDVESVTEEPEVPWALKTHHGRLFRTSYVGEHNRGTGLPDLRLYFKSSLDGIHWDEVGTQPYVYRGGVSEAGFEFDASGGLWAVTRNEDGDLTGFGSHVCYAPPSDLGAWECSARSFPERYDSPLLFRHESEIYMIARRDIGGPFDRGSEGLSFDEQRARNQIEFSLRPKRTGLFRLDQETRTIAFVRDLPGVGDTAFPSILQTGPHSFLFANYTSPLDSPELSWLEGQTSPRGTQIYLLDLTFVPGTPTNDTPTPTPTPTPVASAVTTHARIAFAPVFASPGTPLSIVWPPFDEGPGVVDFGDGTVGVPGVAQHDYPIHAGLFRITASYLSGGNRTTERAALVRAHSIVFAGLRRFTLTKPSDSVAQGVIRNFMPAFYFARVGDMWAVGSDPTAKGDIDPTNIAITTLAEDGDGSFKTDRAAVSAELSAPGGRHSGYKVTLPGVEFFGSTQGDVVVSPLHIRGGILLNDLVTILKELASFDDAHALAFISELFEFDPNDPPETVAFEGEFSVQPYVPAH